MRKNLITLMFVAVCLVSLVYCSNGTKAENEYPIVYIVPEPRVYVIVNQTIAEQLYFHLNRYVTDLAMIGLNASIVEFKHGNHLSLKNILTTAYSKENLVGCLLVGDLPVCYYEDWQTDNETYPIDLFYCDLDGLWNDTDHNGIYDSHTGHRAPEIWIGRLKVPLALEDEVFLLRKYFDRNHNYRIATTTFSSRALIYIDDNWSPMGSMNGSINSAMSLVYDNITIVADDIITTADDYLNRLQESWNFVTLMTHGFYDSHSFDVGEQTGGRITSENITRVDPRALFYNLFSCKTGSYDVDNYITGTYIFASNYSLAAVAPTDSGGMLFQGTFFGNFSRDDFGTSFTKWQKQRIVEEDRFSFWYDWTWYYGMVIIGDPTLSKCPDVQKPSMKEINIAVNEFSPQKTVISNQMINYLNVTLRNQGNATETLKLELMANDTQIGQKTLTLNRFRTAIITFAWDSTDIEPGNYTLSAKLSPLVGESNVEDNLMQVAVIVTIPGDVDGNMKVDIVDLAKIATSFRSRCGDLKYNRNYDLNDDDIINILDLTMAALYFGDKVE